LKDIFDLGEIFQVHQIINRSNACIQEEAKEGIEKFLELAVRNFLYPLF